MKHFMRLTVVFLLCAGLLTVGMAGAETKPPATHKGVKAMSKDEQIALALSGAPPHIAKDAAVMAPGDDGKMVEIKKGTNGFTCIPSVENLPEPDPMCMDAAVKQWVSDLINGAPKPGNTVPGIAYMARGGNHWEKDGKVLMKQEPGAKLVKEPPHWMLMWPFESEAEKLPTIPNASGVYIMFDGTPYAHLMVYQDPMKMK